MTGFKHRGVLLPNAAINRYSNNHGSIMQSLGRSYLFDHARNKTRIRPSVRLRGPEGREILTTGSVS